jgi:hypothetical protein
LLSDDRENDSDSNDILLNLRPTLPRRTLQIPRFSPLAAWKSLAIDSKNDKINSSTHNLNATMDELKHETKIERIYREPSFHLQHLDNKSGEDSGISADKEVGHSPDAGQMAQAYLVSSWTPQQDLEEDEESVDTQTKETYPIEADKNQSFATSSNGHMFSLSLPRDNHSSSDNAPQNNFYSLQKFRKSVADVFGSITNINENKIQIHNYGTDSNWLLGSQPNSIDELSPRKENQIISQVTSGKHVMYLPTNMEYNDCKTQKYESTICIAANNECNEKEENNFNDDYNCQSKKSKNHRFKFQSTIRQVERRKIAEKLSKEAEEKEMLRLSELEAMQRVEEEFQKKRAREKNRIRHQLRIASLDSYEPQSMNSNNNNNNHTFVERSTYHQR